MNRKMASYIRKETLGFTLIELMIVIAIIGTLSAIAVPIFSQYVERTKISKTKIEIRTIEKEILSFFIINNRYPEDLAEIGLENMLDNYGNPYQYQPSTYIDKNGKVKKSTGTRKDHNLVPVNTDFDLYSMGKDGKSTPPFTAKASRDDIVRANNGMFIGLVSSY